MIVVIFEARLAAEGKDDYLDFATHLRNELEKVDGFISIERFESLAEPGKLLSLSFWRDEHAITRWRNLEVHRQAQAAGRSGIFANYRIRVAEVSRDYGLEGRTEAPADSTDHHTK
jgi:heme-degrading monooxygenase HmoA